MRDAYTETGRPSIDPVVFCKLQLVMFFEGIRSERKLIDTVSLHRGHYIRETRPCLHPTDERDVTARQVTATASILNWINRTGGRGRPAVYS